MSSSIKLCPVQFKLCVCVCVCVRARACAHICACACDQFTGDTKYGGKLKENYNSERFGAETQVKPTRNSLGGRNVNLVRIYRNCICKSKIWTGIRLGIFSRESQCVSLLQAFYGSSMISLL